MKHGVGFQTEIQWNLSNIDTMGPLLQIPNIEVSVFWRFLVYFTRHDKLVRKSHVNYARKCQMMANIMWL